MDPLALNGENGQPVEHQYFSDPTAGLTATLTLGHHTGGGATYLLSVRADGDPTTSAPRLIKAETHGNKLMAEQAAFNFWRSYCRDTQARRAAAETRSQHDLVRALSGKGP